MERSMVDSIEVTFEFDRGIVDSDRRSGYIHICSTISCLLAFRRAEFSLTLTLVVVSQLVQRPL